MGESKKEGNRMNKALVTRGNEEKGEKESL